MSGTARRRASLTLALIVASLAALAVPSTSGTFIATVNNTSNTTSAASRFTCKQQFAGDTAKNNAWFEYELTGNAATAPDVSTAGNTGNFKVSGAHPTGTVASTTACPNDTSSPYFYAPDGSTNWLVNSNPVSATPVTFSLMIWFQTTKAGGYLIGLNDSTTKTDSSGGVLYDRHLYVDTGGNVTFGTYNGGYQTVRSPAVYTDGKWHQAVATMSGATGTALWIDGVKVAFNTGYTVAQANTGYWRIAEGTLDGWPNSPTNTYFQGGLRYAAAYKYVMTNNDIAATYANGKPGP